MTEGPGAFLAISAILFVIGTIGVITRRGAITILMSIELMLNSANLALIAVSRHLPAATGDASGIVDGQIVGFFVLAIAAAEVVVGLAIVIALYRLKGSVDIDLARLLRW